MPTVGGGGGVLWIRGWNPQLAATEDDEDDGIEEEEEERRGLDEDDEQHEQWRARHLARGAEQRIPFLLCGE